MDGLNARPAMGEGTLAPAFATGFGMAAARLGGDDDAEDSTDDAGTSIGVLGVAGRSIEPDRTCAGS